MATSELLSNVFRVHDWDFAEYTRVTARGQFDYITPLNGKAIQDPKRLCGLHVRKWMRFGNSVVQLSNLTQLCRRGSINAVYFQESHPFFDVSMIQEATGVLFQRRSGDRFLESDGLVLSGQFFFDSPYRLYEGNERQEILDKYIAPMLPCDFVNGCDLVHENTLTVHIRSGDVFSTMIHPAYGQPPLAYYKLVLEQSNATRVLIVVEDLENPVIVPCAEFARSLGREVIMCTGDLHCTLRILFNSIELVGGIGSFMWAVEALSQRVKKYWYFHRPYDRSVYARRHIRVVRVADVGHYVDDIMRSNWLNTPLQRQLMIDYPVSALRVEEIASGS